MKYVTLDYAYYYIKYLDRELYQYMKVNQKPK